ncbi:WhiB family transcriptional regulator [Nonomuraea fuscirosea]|uniref:WhiB family transcriptional regulator n=1 Tax=Nonomuraea fuscirosea TaxID=1291556 RepID=UPI00371DEE69
MSISRQTRQARREIVTAEWPKRAACIGVPLYVLYPEDRSARRDEKRPRFNKAKARKVCAPCPVRQECLDWALRSNDTEGVHGGLMPDEQVAERRRRVRNKTLWPAQLAG